MSISISITTPECHHSRRIGTNCAQCTMMALWFAAYAVSGKPESTRVRSRWIEPRQISLPNVTPIEWPIPYHEWTLVRGIKALLSYNKDDCAWVQMNENTIKRGLALKTPTDPSLKALVEFYGYACHVPWPQDIIASAAARIAPVLSELLPQLSESCWYDQMKDYAEIFTLAAKADTKVGIG